MYYLNIGEFMMINAVQYSLAMTFYREFFVLAVPQELDMDIFSPFYLFIIFMFGNQ